MFGLYLKGSSHSRDGDTDDDIRIITDSGSSSHKSNDDSVAAHDSSEQVTMVTAFQMLL